LIIARRPGRRRRDGLLTTQSSRRPTGSPTRSRVLDRDRIVARGTAEELKARVGGATPNGCSALCSRPDA
jgi:hypothetical protein